MTPPMDEQPKRSNVRTAMIMLSIAAVFFLGVIAKRVFFG